MTAYGTARATAEDIPALRVMPAPVADEPFPSGLLKHSDEQTVVGLAAVLQAIRDHSLAGQSFREWGVLAAPRFLGRATLASALQRFALEGAWGVSPHLIPHRSLHSVSGTVSQALGIRGPNFGVGGGPLSVAEVMLTGAALLAEHRVPGVWLVISGWHPEPVLDRLGGALANGHHAPTVCKAVALALTARLGARPGYRLHVSPEAEPVRDAALGITDENTPLLTLENLWTALAASGSSDMTWKLGCGGWLGLRRSHDGTEN